MQNLQQLIGIHHVTAITSSAQKIYDFYTNTLGLRLVQKNVNQDDISTYHLFFADNEGSPGTDMTFFDFKDIPKTKHGTDSISKTSFRVKSDEALNYWLKRFKHYNVKHSEISERFNRKVIYFEDFDTQQYALFSDENDTGVNAGIPWYLGPVPDEFAIVGLGPSYLKVSKLDLMETILVDIMKMRKSKTEENYHFFEMGDGGNGGSVIVEEDSSNTYARQGYGSVHHVAFRVSDKNHLEAWENHFNSLNLRNSGYVDRFYFQSVYIRLYPNILFELATDGPGFVDDEETLETLGEKLTLPPHLRDKRDFVEKHLKTFDTTRSNKVFEKEYFND